MIFYKTTFTQSYITVEPSLWCFYNVNTELVNELPVGKCLTLSNCYSTKQALSLFTVGDRYITLSAKGLKLILSGQDNIFVLKYFFINFIWNLEFLFLDKSIKKQYVIFVMNIFVPNDFLWKVFLNWKLQDCINSSSIFYD